MEKERENTLRLFFALWPDEAVREALAAWQPPLRERCGGRPMRADTLHCTLAFLGEVAAHRLEALQLAAQEVAATPFELDFDVARYWGHNHIAYAAPSQSPDALNELAADLHQRLRKHRFRFEEHTFKPHVTLLRHAKWSDQPLPGMPRVHWNVQDFVLASSLSDEQGARYEVLARIPLLR